MEERELVAEAAISHQLDDIATRLERLEATLTRLQKHSGTNTPAAARRGRARAASPESENST